MAKGGEVRWGLWYRSIRPLAQEVREDGACGAGRHDRWCRWWRLSIIGAGRCRLRRRWYASLARVDGVLGAGEVFGWGPAPQNGLLRFPVAQVLPLFPHLRHLHLTPAPAVPHTCASCTTCTPTCITYPTCATYPTRIPHLLQSPRTPAPLRCECGVAGMRGRERAKTGLKCHKLEKGSKGGNVSQNGGEGGPGAGKFVDLEDLQK